MRSMKIGHSTGSRVEMFSDVVALLVRKPRSVGEVVEVTGYCDQTVARYFTVLKSDGLIAVCDVTGPRGVVPVYKWVGGADA